jgi:hypothetical protein
LISRVETLRFEIGNALAKGFELVFRSRIKILQSSLVLCPSASLREKVFSFLLGSILVPTLCAQTLDTGGHLNYRFQHIGYPADSVFDTLAGSSATDHVISFRYTFGARYEEWKAQADYQVLVLYGNTFELSHDLSDNELIPRQLPNDDHRLFNLSRVISDVNKKIVLHRLDRLSLGYTNSKGVIRLGRQAISWGNGMIFTPMDFFNPFDPAAIDKEYKTGDDMLYGQYLESNGNDLQGVWVLRRNEIGSVTSELDSIAFKFHGFVSDIEYDLLVARHFGDEILGGGAIFNLGGGVLQGDLMLTHIDDHTVFSAVTSFSYSWIWWNRNISGMVEAFYNGFGQPDGDYSPVSLDENHDLIDRINRGGLFTLGREYLAVSATIEINSLWILSPNAFINVTDGSALFQVVSHHDVAQNWQVQATLNLPVGIRGTEYGGIETGIENGGGPDTLSTDWSFTLQLAWYF